MQSRMEAEEAFRQLAEGLGRSGAPDFYDTLVARLATILKVDHVLVARVTEDAMVRTQAVWSHGQPRPNITYPLAGTPCEIVVVGEATCHYAEGLQARFPDDRLLRQLGAVSYLGLPLLAADETPLGLLAVLKNTPMKAAGLEKEVLRIAAVQAGAELGRSRAELAVKESERRLDTLLNHLPGMAYRCLNDRDWTMRVVSQGAQALTGYRAEELQDNRVTSYAALIHPADRERVFEEVQAAVARRAPFRVIYRLHHAGGDTRWMWEQGQGVFAAAGELLHLEGFITDITEQHEAQRVQEAVMQVASTVTTRIGDDYFHQLVSTLVEILEADAGFIALLDSSRPDVDPLSGRASATMSMVSVVAEGQRLDNYAYALAGTSCEQILGEREAMVQDGSTARLPGGAGVARAWIGRRLDNAKGEPIGVVMVLYCRPLEANAFATSVLRILSTGAAAELERRRDHRRMHQLAYTDGTTGLPNRVRFMEELMRLRQEAEKGQHPLLLLLLDIRRFKEINDLHGHQVGDQLLSTTAGRLARAMGPHEVLARLSGDEFAVLVPQAKASGLEQSIRRLQAAVSRPIELGHRSFVLEVSIGSARYPRDAVTPGELFKSASIALYHAKQQDGGTCPFDESMTRALQRRQQMTERLSAAISGQRLELHFQPQVDLRTGELVGAEALCRWHDEAWGWVSPGEFIPLAEERGLIRPLGDWVLQAASRQMAAWRREGMALPGRLSLNVSAQQFVDPQLAEHIATLTRGIPASAIGLELTESDFMRDPEQAVGITHAPRGGGLAAVPR
ncbi:diguanylate cyclase [Halomonas sp. 25-S5]|uniref:diguanylate cyclase domain-containing protein n=1 Tax=Halomonas sp. 25-S5 TaxID=2994065 RepID=UPI0024687060|nr:diguanylate cyclase [Halomonas sp. 25-S5]